ncbi:MAG: type II toxin-antitoxin system VapC family toxin [Chloroflexota bacterium]
MIVVDTNILAYWFLPSDFVKIIEEVRKKDAHWVAPPLWQSEFRNILALYLRKNQISLFDAKASMKEAERLLKNKTYPVESDWVLQLVQTSLCSAYDCEFVALANRFNVPLITMDKKILKEFPKTAVSPTMFLT